MWTERDEHKIDMMIAYDEGREAGEKCGEKRGKKRGKLEGRKEEKIETAKNLLKAGVNIDIIVQATKLSEQQIMKYQNS